MIITDKSQWIRTIRSELTLFQEYMALKRYHSEKQLPARFQVLGGVGS